MIEIKDPQQIERWLARYSIRDYFDTSDLRFTAFQYKKGEFLTAPHLPFTHLLLVHHGKLGN